MRELPLSVWKARRTVVSCSLSLALRASAVSASRAVVTTSAASSRKMPSISSSMAASACGIGALGAGAGGATGAAASMNCCSDSAAWLPAASPPDESSCCCACCAACARPRSSAARASWEMRSRSRARSSVERSPCATAWAVAWSWSINCGWAAASAAASSCAWARCSLSRPTSDCSSPVSSSKRNMRLASCGWTLSMSIRKPSAPRLWASRSNCARGPGSEGSTSVLASSSTWSRIFSVACAACDRPSTLNTPRIACSWPGTGISRSRLDGSRKYSSHWRSTSERLARSSWTTEPSVCRSATRRYSSSIQLSSASGASPWPTDSMRRARLLTRSACSGWSKASSSRAASR